MKQVFKCIIFLLFPFNLIFTQEEEANRIITFFIEEFPSSKKFLIDRDSAAQVCNIISCKSLNISPNFGIFSTYMGYLTLSNEVGQIIFPRKTLKDNINLLVTQKILPVFMFQNTIAYWEIPKGISAKMYCFTRKQDEETGLFYWDVVEKKINPKGKIPLHTIILFANPESIYIPTGITVSNNNPQLLLPTIYAKNDPQYLQNALFILTIKPFFSKINKLFKERPFGYAEHIT